MTETQDSRESPEHPGVQPCRRGTTLLGRAAAATAGRAALTLVPGTPLKQTLLALGEACSWPSTPLLGRRRSRSCRAGCGW
jgi:hypothetical protein